MATDPRLLQFQDTGSLNLSITPGSVEKQGESVGGEYRVGTGPLYVGKSSEESLFESLSMIAGGIIGTTSNLVQYQAAVDEGKRQKFLAEWESPDGPASQIKADPNLTDEEKVNKTTEWLEANVPNQNSNRVFGAKMMRDWLDNNPLTNEIFDEKFAKFQEEAITLTPDQRLELFDERFKYFTSSELPSAVSARTTLLGQNVEHNTALNSATDTLVIESQSSSFRDVALAVLESKTGNQQALNLLRENAKDSASKQELENQIQLAEDYIETPTVDFIDAAVFSGVTGSGPKEPGTIQDSYYEERNQKARVASIKLHNELIGKVIQGKANWETSTREQQLLRVAQFGLPENPTLATAQVINPILATAVYNQDTTSIAKTQGSILQAVVSTAKRNKWDEDQTTEYYYNVLAQAWKDGTETTRKWLISSGMFGIDEAELSRKYPDGSAFKMSEYPAEFVQQSKDNLRFSLDENNEFTGHLTKQAALIASGSEAMPQTVTSPNELPQFGAYFRNLITTNNPYALRGPFVEGDSYNKQVIKGFDDMGLGSELLNETTGPIVWATLGLPTSDYALWLAVQQGRDIDPAVASSIENRYGSIRTPDEAITYNQEQNSNPKWSAMNAAAKRELVKIYQFNKAAGDSGGPTFPGFFATEGDAKTILGGVSTSSQAQNQSAFDFATQTAEGSQLSLKVTQITQSLEYRKSLKGTTLDFELPVGQNINGQFVPFPEEMVDSVFSFVKKRKEELNEQLKSGNINQIQYNAIMSRMGQGAQRYAVGLLLDKEIADNAETYLGSKPEKQEAQLALYRKWKESYLNLNEEFYYWSSNTSDPDLFYGGPSILSLYSGDNKLKNITFNATDSGLEDEEELKKWYRLAFSFSRGLYNEEEVRSELKKHFEVFSIARSSGSSVADMLKTEEGKQAYYTLMAYMSGVNERARAEVLRSGNAFDMPSFNIARNAIIQKELSGGAETYIPAARWLSGFNLLTNSPDARSGAYKVTDPSGAYLNVTSDQLKSYEDQENQQSKQTAEAVRFMLQGAPDFLNPTETVGAPNIRGARPNIPSLAEPLVMSGTPLTARGRAEEGLEWNYNTQRDNILARVEQVYFIPGASPQQKFNNLLTLMADATGNTGTSANRLQPYDTATGQFLSPQYGGIAEDQLWQSSQPGMIDDTSSLQSMGAGDPILQFEVLAAQLSKTGGFIDFLSGVERNSSSYSTGGKINLESVLTQFNQIGFIFDQQKGLPLVDYRQAIETGGINEMVSGNVGVRMFYPEPENKKAVTEMIHTLSYVPPAIFDSTGKEEVIKEGTIYDDTMLLPSVNGKESVGALTYLFVPHRKPLSTDQLGTFVRAELENAGVDLDSSETRGKINDVISVIEGRQRMSSNPIYRTNAFILHAISQSFNQYKIPSFVYNDNQAIMASTRKAHFNLGDDGSIYQFAAIGNDPINENSNKRSLGIKFRSEYFPISGFKDKDYLGEQYKQLEAWKKQSENFWGIVRSSYDTLRGGE